VMHHGACMVRLTRLPPSKHVLTLSTPHKSKLKACNEFKYKFRGGFTLVGMLSLMTLHYSLL
jgi:hypothetical protein